MQIAIEKPIQHPKRMRKISPLFSSGLINQFDKAGVIKTMPVKFEKKQQPEKALDFSNWNMPEQEMGVIKCKEHDFL